MLLCFSSPFPFLFSLPLPIFLFPFPLPFSLFPFPYPFSFPSPYHKFNNRDALDALKLRRYCCRRMLLTHADIIGKLFVFHFIYLFLNCFVLCLCCICYYFLLNVVGFAGYCCWMFVAIFAFQKNDFFVLMFSFFLSFLSFSFPPE